MLPTQYKSPIRYFFPFWWQHEIVVQRAYYEVAPSQSGRLSSGRARYCRETLVDFAAVTATTAKPGVRQLEKQIARTQLISFLQRNALEWLCEHWSEYSPRQRNQELMCQEALDAGRTNWHGRAIADFRQHPRRFWCSWQELYPM